MEEDADLSLCMDPSQSTEVEESVTFSLRLEETNVEDEQSLRITSKSFSLNVRKAEEKEETVYEEEMEEKGVKDQGGREGGLRDQGAQEGEDEEEEEVVSVKRKKKRIKDQRGEEEEAANQRDRRDREEDEGRRQQTEMEEDESKETAEETEGQSPRKKKRLRKRAKSSDEDNEEKTEEKVSKKNDSEEDMEDEPTKRSKHETEDEKEEDEVEEESKPKKNKKKTKEDERKSANSYENSTSSAIVERIKEKRTKSYGEDNRVVSALDALLKAREQGVRDFDLAAAEKSLAEEKNRERKKESSCKSSSSIEKKKKKKKKEDKKDKKKSKNKGSGEEEDDDDEDAQEEEEDEDDEEEEEEEVEEKDDDSADEDYGTTKRRKTNRKTAGKTTAQQKQTGKKSGSMSPFVVDPAYGLGPSACVLEDKGKPLACMLNYTDVTYGVRGNNKFYFMQLISTGSSFALHTKWGRVGAPNPQYQLKKISDRQQAIQAFNKQFRSKTQNTWGTKFATVKGKYVLIDVVRGEEGEDEDDDADAPPSNIPVPESKLDPKVKGLVELICSKQMLKQTMTDMQVDTDRFPLGQLSRGQISKGYAILSKLHDALVAKDTAAVGQYTSEFYTLIPHDLGFGALPLIDTLAKLKQKVGLLDTLGQIEVANRTMRDSLKLKLNQNPTDIHYSMLKSSITPIEPPPWLLKAMVSTHGPTHKEFSLEVQNVFAVERHSERAKFVPFRVLERRLLWHGTRLTNFVGILSQGLRVAPPEAPRTGYMFGKGIYFADCVSKSANYIHATRDNPVGLLLLGEVAIGNTYDIKQAEYMLKPPNGFHSTQGVGKFIPNPKYEEKVEGARIGMGPLVETGPKDSSLMYNEFIVYDVGQIYVRYLVVVKFKFNSMP